MSQAIVVDALAHAVQGGVFVAVGSRLALRPVWSGDRLAVQAFAAWWFLYGLQSILTAVRLAGVADGELSVPFYMVLFSIEVVLSFLALGGLALYVLYLWHGRYLPPTFLFSCLAVLGFVYVVVLQWHDPASVVADGPRAVVQFERGLAEPLHWGLLAGYYVPVLVLAGLFSYVGSISGGPQRVRAVGTGVTLLLLAVADMLTLAPVPLMGADWLPPLLRTASAAAAAWSFLRDS